MRRMTLTALLLLAAQPLLPAQSSSPTFEVASVKLAPKQDRGTPRSLGDAIANLPAVQVLPGGGVRSHTAIRSAT